MKWRFFTAREKKGKARYGHGMACERECHMAFGILPAFIIRFSFSFGFLTKGKGGNELYQEGREGKGREGKGGEGKYRFLGKGRWEERERFDKRWPLCVCLFWGLEWEIFFFVCDTPKQLLY